MWQREVEKVEEKNYFHVPVFPYTETGFHMFLMCAVHYIMEVRLEK